MRAVRYDLYIEKGATFSRVFRYKDANGVAIDLTGYVARMKVRAPDHAGDVVAGFDLSVENSPPEITIDGEAGEVAVEIADEITEAVDSATCAGVYDLEIESPAGKVTRLVEGKVRFSPEATRPDVSGS
jgi:hypothetical protein